MFGNNLSLGIRIFKSPKFDLSLRWNKKFSLTPWFQRIKIILKEVPKRSSHVDLCHNWLSFLNFVFHIFWILSSLLSLQLYWTHYIQNRETQHVNIVLQCVYWFFWTAKYERKSCFELNDKPSNVTMLSTDFSFQTVVFWNLFEFSRAEIILKINISHILNPNLTK